jgi:hypothetical protein
MASNQQLRPASKATQTPSRNSVLPSAISNLARLEPALARLTAMKKQANLTTFELETWVAGLSIFDTAIVNEAVVRIGLSEDPFPDLGKLVMRCDAIRREKTGSVRTGDSKQLGTATIEKLAEAMGLAFK